MELVKLKPFLSEKIWGGDQLKSFGYQLPKDKKIGEAWIISAHPHGMTYLTAGTFKNQALQKVFEENRELFGDFKGEFPLLVKILSPSDFLSVQVHPDDFFAQKHHQSLGKPESWYVLDAPKNATLIYGHEAKSREQLQQMVTKGEWKTLLKKIHVSAGDFLYVPPGKIHAVTPGVIICEIQRSSDLTYRFYDYDRIDEHGIKRPLEIQKSLACTTVPDDQDFVIRQAQKQIFSNQYFSIYLWNVAQEPKFKLQGAPYWLQFTVIQGSGKINGQDFKQGDAAITLGSLESLQGIGDLQILVSWINKPKTI